MAGLLLRVLITEHIQVVVYQTAYGKILKCLSDLETYTSSTRVPEGVRLIFFWGGGFRGPIYRTYSTSSISDCLRTERL